MKQLIITTTFLMVIATYANPILVLRQGTCKNKKGTWDVYDGNQHIGFFEASCRVQQNTTKDIYVDLTKDKEFYNIVKNLYDKAKIKTDFTKTQISNQLQKK